MRAGHPPHSRRTTTSTTRYTKSTRIKLTRERKDKAPPHKEKRTPLPQQIGTSKRNDTNHESNPRAKRFERKVEATYLVGNDVESFGAPPQHAVTVICQVREGYEDAAQSNALPNSHAHTHARAHTHTKTQKPSRKTTRLARESPNAPPFSPIRRRRKIKTPKPESRDENWRKPYGAHLYTCTPC